MAKQPKTMITGKVVNQKVFDTLISRAASMNSKMAETRGELGSFIKDAEETHGIHRGAFKLALKLHNMEDLKMKDFLRGFDLYREYLKLDTRAAQDLLANDGEEDGDDDLEQDDAGASDEEWDASAPDDGDDEVDGDDADEALAPGLVKVGGEVVKLGPKPRAAKTEPDGSTTDPEEMGRRLSGAEPNALDDLTSGRRH